MRFNWITLGTWRFHMNYTTTADSKINNESRKNLALLRNIELENLQYQIQPKKCTQKSHVLITY